MGIAKEGSEEVRNDDLATPITQLAGCRQITTDNQPDVLVVCHSWSSVGRPNTLCQSLAVLVACSAARKLFSR